MHAADNVPQVKEHKSSHTSQEKQTINEEFYLLCDDTFALHSKVSPITHSLLENTAYSEHFDPRKHVLHTAAIFSAAYFLVVVEWNFSEIDSSEASRSVLYKELGTDACVDQRSSEKMLQLVGKRHIIGKQWAETALETKLINVGGPTVGSPSPPSR